MPFGHTYVDLGADYDEERCRIRYLFFWGCIASELLATKQDVYTPRLDGSRNCHRRTEDSLPRSRQKDATPCSTA